MNFYSRSHSPGGRRDTERARPLTPPSAHTRRGVYWCTHRGHKNPRTPWPRGVPVWTLATLGTSPVHARPVEAPTPRFDSRGCPVHRHPRPRAEEAGRTSSTRLLQLAGVERLPRAMNEIWYQGSETPRSGRRVTRVVGQAARGALEHASARPLSSTLCALRAQAIDAAQGQPGREGRR